MDVAIASECDGDHLNWFVLETSKVGIKAIHLPNNHQWLSRVVRPCCDRDIFKVSLTLVKGNCCHPIEALVLCGNVINWIKFKPGQEQSVQSARYHSTRVVYLSGDSRCANCDHETKLGAFFLYSGININAYHERNSNYIWDILSSKNRFYMKLRKTQCINPLEVTEGEDVITLNVLYFDSFGVYRVSRVALKADEEVDITPQDMHVNSITGIRDHLHVIFVEKTSVPKVTNLQLNDSIDVSFELVKSISGREKFFKYSPIDHLQKLILQLVSWFLGRMAKKMTKMDDSMFH